jgi:hypothetical protein
MHEDKYRASAPELDFPFFQGIGGLENHERFCPDNISLCLPKALYQPGADI